MNNNTVRMDVNSGRIIPLNVSTPKTVSMDVTTGGGGSSIDCMKYKRVRTKYDLPNIGRENTLYIVTSTYDAYIWDKSQGSYYPIGQTQENFGIISCGDAYFEMEDDD